MRHLANHETKHARLGTVISQTADIQ